MIIPVDAEDIFIKIQHSFMERTVLKASYLNVIRAMFNKLMFNTILKAGTESISSTNKKQDIGI